MNIYSEKSLADIYRLVYVSTVLGSKNIYQDIMDSRKDFIIDEYIEWAVAHKLELNLDIFRSGFKLVPKSRIWDSVSEIYSIIPQNIINTRWFKYLEDNCTDTMLSKEDFLNQPKQLRMALTLDFAIKLVLESYPDY